MPSEHVGSIVDVQCCVELETDVGRVNVENEVVASCGKLTTHINVRFSLSVC